MLAADLFEKFALSYQRANVSLIQRDFVASIFALTLDDKHISLLHSVQKESVYIFGT